ncbi:MAG TPA: methyltransferase domain-containing protein [Pyrinomonadaceae bacterium]|jgi:SAM-dependent methyltransferase
MNPLDRQRYVERYTSRYRRFGYDPLTLGWGKGGRQEIRFAALLGMAPEPRGRVLDVGCGFGDLYGYLRKVGWEGDYVGLDIVPKLLEVAREQYPGIDVRACDILEEGASPGEFDYVVASGVFNARLHGESNETYIGAMLRRMLGLARVGVAADFLSTHVDFRHEDAHHSDPAALLGLAMKLTRRAAVRHDYLPFEFCVYLYKQSGITADSRYAVEPGARES